MFFDLTDAVPSLSEVTTYQMSDMTCGWIDRAGTVVLLASRLPIAATTNDSDSTAFLLTDCTVVTTTRVNFRPAPASSQVTAVVPANSRLAASARSAGWYKALFGGRFWLDQRGLRVDRRPLLEGGLSAWAWRIWMPRPSQPTIDAPQIPPSHWRKFRKRVGDQQAIRWSAVQLLEYKSLTSTRSQCRGG